MPDELAAQLTKPGVDPARAALEAIGLEAYREGQLTEHQLANLLGLNRYDLDGFLKRHEIWIDYTVEDFERERAIGERLLKEII